MTHLLLIVISIGFAWVHYIIAGNKGLNKPFWTAMGFLFGPFSLPFILLAKKT